jgi:hypothetical protein
MLTSMTHTAAMEKRIAQSKDLMKYCDSVYTTQRRKTSTVTAGDGVSLLLLLLLVLLLLLLLLYTRTCMRIDWGVDWDSQDRIGSSHRAADDDNCLDH